MNGSLEHPYTNPKAPVHVTTGSAVQRINFHIEFFTFTIISIFRVAEKNVMSLFKNYHIGQPFAATIMDILVY